MQSIAYHTVAAAARPTEQEPHQARCVGAITKGHNLKKSRQSVHELVYERAEHSAAP